MLRKQRKKQKQNISTRALCDKEQFMKTIAIIGSCDTKYREIAYMREKIEAHGVKAIVVDVATGPNSSKGYDISREQVIRAGGSTWKEMETKSKGEKIAFMMKAVAKLAEKLYQEGRIQGVISAGGLQNTVMAVSAMQVLPIGVPKVMATTVACGRKTFDSVVGNKDIVVIPSICDFTGLNSVTRKILENACACCAGMVKFAGREIEKSSRPVVGVTLMGITNVGACAAIDELERMGIETLGFHATGSGGPIMEQMAADGLLDGILDLTIHELTQEYFGGGFSYSVEAKERLRKGVAHKIPLVVCPGGMDFIDFKENELPDRMNERVWMYHNADTLHIKILPDEAAIVAKRVVERLEQIEYPIKLLLPTDGMRHNTQKGEELYNPEVDAILLEGLRSVKNPCVQVITISGNLDTKAWGIEAAHQMVQELNEAKCIKEKG